MEGTTSRNRKGAEQIQAKRRRKSVNPIQKKKKIREAPTKKTTDKTTGVKYEGAKRKQNGLVPTGNPVAKGNLRSERLQTEGKGP